MIPVVLTASPSALTDLFSQLFTFRINYSEIMNLIQLLGLLDTYTGQQKHIKRQTAMPQVRFKSKIPVFGRAKTFRASDRAYTVIGPA
jgi:hypothetical protein